MNTAVKLPKSANARQYCPKIREIPGTLGTPANSSPEYYRYYIQIDMNICAYRAILEPEVLQYQTQMLELRPACLGISPIELRVFSL